MSDTAAIELLKRAVQLDNEQKLSDALVCYSEGIRMLLTAVKDIPSSDERKRTAYRQKITECIDRAEQLKDLIQQQKVVQDACAPSTTTIRCPNSYTIVLVSILYGVAQQPGSCVYTPGDCIADSSSTISCSTDSLQCIIPAYKKRLPQCNDAYGDYIRIEHQCVPISMEDSGKEYNVCQNGTDITTDHGIIRSPGYPTQFQTTNAECFRAIHAPDNKVIRLWLTDMYIGSTMGSNCLKDHLLVVDSIQTFRDCSLRRIAYPYLCSSTILIQYLATTNSPVYRGIRMYFEIVDRPANDDCPKVSVTPVPDSTTTLTPIDPETSTNTPIYVLLGISSPTRSIQLCKGQSYVAECPANYVIAITTNIYGVTPSDQCEPHDTVKHCVVTMEPNFYCRERCTLLYGGNQRLPSCNNQLATYQYIEYQCIPTQTAHVTTDTPCPADGSMIPIQINRNGRFRSVGYPYLQQMNCTYRVTTKPGDIMNIYALDISLNDFSTDCTRGNKMTITEAGDNAIFCEERNFELIYSSCSNEFDLNYVVTDTSLFISNGVELYIESQARPFDWLCGKAPSTTPPPPLTTPFTIPTATSISVSSFVGALNETERDICFNDKPSFSCPFGFTFMLNDAFYGVKQTASAQCGFVLGDCVQDATSTITTCKHDEPTCYLPYSVKRRLAQCNDQYADYMHITYQCIPSRELTADLKPTDICDTNNPINGFNGLITSPGFPTYRQTSQECKRPILPMREKALKIWINEMAIGSGGQRLATDDSDEADLIIHRTRTSSDLNDEGQLFAGIRDICPKDYLIINAPHVAYVYCGTRKFSLPPLCADEIYIQYSATSPPNLFYKGFKMYFEAIDKPIEITCGGTPGTIDPTATTTTPGNVPLSIWAQNLDVSPAFSQHLCLGTMTTISCERPSDYVLSIADTYYGVTGTGQCELPSASHCHQPTFLNLPCTHSCFIEYTLPRPLSFCSDANADYLNIDYRCIPTRLPNNQLPMDICATTTTDTLAIDKGILISPQYPILGAARTCSKTIETVPNKIWKVYITDLFLEGKNDFGDCVDASLTIYDGNEKLILCGLLPPELIMISCSNKVQFNFVSSRQALGYRGFKVFFETIDVPDDWPCVPAGFTTMTTMLTTRPPIVSTSVPPSLQIPAYGGTTNGTGQFCTLPFIYLGNLQVTCISTENPPTPVSLLRATEPWCALTDNFDRDQQWGYCDLGVTGSTIYDICRSNTLTLKCQPGYVIDIISAAYAAKPDSSTTGPNACTYDQNDCFQNDDSTIQATCAGKNTCVAVHFAKTLTSCQNRPSAYFHIDYVCVPNTVQGITTFDLCGTTIPTDGIHRGYLISPNFPNTGVNLDCTFTIQTSDPHRDVHVYMLDMDLSPPAVIGQGCSKDRLIARYDNTQTEYCGRSYTNFMLNTCHSFVSIQLIRASDGKGRGVKLYFEFRERPPHVPCPVLPTTIATSRPPPGTTTTTPAPLPPYFPDPSPLLFKTLCYPDISAIFGLNNLQCPQDYALVNRRAFYGKGNRCDYNPGDCISETDLIYRTCAGKRACSVSFFSVVAMAECDKEIANYLFIEYQCLPTPAIVPQVQDLCTSQINQGSGVSGILTSPSYPTYVQTQCANNTLSPFDGSNLVVYVYILELDIGSPDSTTGQCTSDFLSLSYQCNNVMNEVRLCGTRKAELLFSTCSPTDKIYVSYSLTNPSSQTQRGFALVYHFLPQPITPPPPITTTTARTTTPMPGAGPVSTPVRVQFVCVLQSMQLRCEQPNYILVLHNIDLAVSKTPGSCLYSPDDCFEERTDLRTSCAGLSSCYIFAPSKALKSCNNSMATYFYASYQCLPTQPKVNVDICSSPTSVERVYGGAIISSLNYTSSLRQCKIELQAAALLGSNEHKGFRIFIVMLKLPVSISREQQQERSSCNAVDPFVEINDMILTPTRLCGDLHARVLFETTSSVVHVTFQDYNRPPTTTKYKGFQLYLEAFSVGTLPPGPPATPPTPTEPMVLKRQIVCASSFGRDRISFACTPNHALVFRQSIQYVTKDPTACDIEQQTCYWQSDQPQASCGGQESCEFIHTLPQFPSFNPCSNGKGDTIEFYYQCIPIRATQTYSTYTFCTDMILSSTEGFIETPGYPLSYPYNRQNCQTRIRITTNPGDNPLFIHLYIVDMAIRNTLSTSPSSNIECVDMISYNDGPIEKKLCGFIDQPVIEFRTNETELILTLNAGGQVLTDDPSSLRGARLFYSINDQPVPRPPQQTVSSTSMPSTTTTKTSTALIDPRDKHDRHAGMIAGIILGVMAAILALIGFVLYRRRANVNGGETPQVRYQTGMDVVDSGVPNGDKIHASSIPKASLTSPTALVNPLYKIGQSKTPQMEDSSNA